MPRPKNPLAKLSLDELNFLADRNSHSEAALRRIYAHVSAKKPSKTEQLKSKLERMLQVGGQLFTREEVQILVAKARQEASRYTHFAEGGVQFAVFACQGCANKIRVPLNRGSGLSTCPVCGEVYSLRQDGREIVIEPMAGARRKKNPGQQEHSRERTSLGAVPSMRRSEAYRVLGLSPGASEQDISQARKRLLQQLHPDKHQASPERVKALVEEEFKKVEAAYKKLQEVNA